MTTPTNWHTFAPGSVCTFTTRKMNAPGVYFVPLTPKRHGVVLDRLRDRERTRRATGQEVGTLMQAKANPTWRLWQRHQRVRREDGTRKEHMTFTLMSPDGERRLRARKAKPKPVQPMKATGVKE